MAHAIAWIFEALLRLVLPPSGRHRAAGHPTARVSDGPARPRAAECMIASAAAFRPVSGPPDGPGAAMVRPYVVADEQRSKRRPRVELVCAPHGMVVIR
ncbi:hypothetical protein ACWDSL_40795 [Streptomyces sp. NPDC000941]